MPHIPKCNQCDSAIINGVYSHEFGCPNRYKVWEAGLEMWVEEEYAGIGDGLFDEEWDVEYEEDEDEN